MQLPANPYEMAVLALFPPLGGEILKKTILYDTVRDDAQVHDALAVNRARNLNTVSVLFQLQRCHADGQRGAQLSADAMVANGSIGVIVSHRVERAAGEDAPA
jgi:hypothetical protein